MRALETATGFVKRRLREEPGVLGHVLLVGGFTLLGLVLRCVCLGAESLWLDESISVRTISRPWLELPRYLGTESVHPPLYFLLLRLWTSLFGFSEAALRFPSVLAGTLSIPLVAALGTKLRDRRTGEFAAALLSVAPFHVYYSQEARPYALLGLLVLWSLLAYHRMIEAPSRRAAVAYLVSSILLLHTHAYAVFTILAQNLHYLLVWRAAQGRGGLTLKGWIGLQVALGALFLPWVPAMLVQYRNRHLWAWHPAPGLRTPWDTLHAFGSGSRLLAAWLGLLALVGIAIPWFRLPRRDWLDSCGSALVWMLVPFAVPVVLSRLLHPMYEPRYAVQPFLGLLLLGAIGLASVARAKLLRAALMLLVLLLPVRGLTRLYAERQKPPWREIVSFVEGRADEADCVVLAPWYVRPAYDRYSNGTRTELELRESTDPADGYVILDVREPGRRPRPGRRVFLVARYEWLGLRGPDDLRALGESVLPDHRLEETETFHGVMVGVFRSRDDR